MIITLLQFLKIQITIRLTYKHKQLYCRRECTHSESKDGMDWSLQDRYDRFYIIKNEKFKVLRFQYVSEL